MRSGADDGLAVNLAWAYVGLRIAHSLVQSIGNKVMLRFPVFALSSIMLIVMTVRALLAL
ncbi:MAG: MAPEG family protein [Pseudomonadota bacterium]